MTSSVGLEGENGRPGIVLALWQAPAGARKLNRLLPLLADEMTIGSPGKLAAIRG
jgi:hypothetical protein